jgi:hypothetical protein
MERFEEEPWKTHQRRVGEAPCDGVKVELNTRHLATKREMQDLAIMQTTEI